MARRYASVGDQAATASDSILGLTSATTIRPILYDVVFGCGATPADNAYRMQIGRYTAAGTSTAVTPQALDPSDPAAIATAGSNHTAEPTYTSGAVVLDFGINQQATFRWVAPVEEGIMLPATAANGVGLYFSAVSGGTAECSATFHHAE